MKKECNHKKKTITWDEKSISEQNNERGTRMKITEVSTPFNYDTWDSGSEEDFNLRSEHFKEVQKTVTEEVVNRLMEIKNDDEKRKNFEEQRKKHYDEYKTIKALKEEGKLSCEE
ncbi:Protein phosphatase inhibitor 2 (IPP-2) family protein [Theileria parva strain Muguga]|uniref:Protein phosphatase inhibitor 2 n=1 Tax=Theileria parva TaxID=5875 RepID=Q4N5J9_THEPA|nr:Protein phosphatase inhibitor 2 (IPP-2) family protein [Theileria parva strain Muguga]EAN32574.1 Protein phosphatase inhibitor 2 (IPP-2) family protein [Theileria parva strain Muguga]|eukprot:XP_764857.1 hypothetical protein [Theileria parva strain Muguga]